jgi:hypothetical protein
MPLTVRDLLDTPSLVLRVLVEGRPDRPIRWVHSTEQADPTPFLRGGEVVLTDGVALRAGTSAQEYVTAMVGAGVVAIGYGLIDHTSRTPPSLIRACAAAAMTLFEVPVPVPYIAISEVFVEAFSEERQAALVAAVERNERLMRAATAGEGLGATLELLRGDLGRAVCVLDPQGRLMASAGEPRAPDRTVAPEGWAVLEVRSIDRTEALLGVHEAERRLSVDERAAADQAAAFLALQLVHERALRETHRRFALEIFDLLDAGQASAAAVATRLRAFGITPEQPLVVVVAEAADPRLEQVEYALADAGLAGLAAARGGRVFVIAQWEGPSSGLPAFAEQLTQALDHEAPIGVSGVASSSAGLHRGLGEAMHACAIARQRGAAGYVTHDEMGSHRLLLSLQEPRVVSSLAHALLDPIVQYDARRGSELLETLTAFLESNGQWQATASVLHIHVNTLRHRIARIEELTGRSLDTMDGRVDLFLALRARGLDSAGDGAR